MPHQSRLSRGKKAPPGLPPPSAAFPPVPRALRSDRGAALMLTLSFSFFAAIILYQVISDSMWEHSSAARRLRALQAQSYAEAAAELSLFRLRVFKEAQKALKGGKPELSAMLKPYADFIWRLPALWPFPLPPDPSESLKGEILQLREDSFLKGEWQSFLSPEDGKINLSHLISPVEYLREFSFDTLSALLFALGERMGKEWDSGFISQLLLNIADEMDKDLDDTAKGGGGLSSEFALNRSFLFVEEMALSAGVTEDVFRALSGYVTAHGISGININYIQPDLLRAIGLEAGADEVVLARILPASPDYRPFADSKDFCSFLSSFGSAFCSLLEEKYGTLDMLQFDTPSNFRIQSEGRSGRSVQSLRAIAYDLNLSLEGYARAVETHNKLLFPDEEPSGISSENGKSKSGKLKAGHALYKTLSPFFVLYWKEGLP